jgi:diamine N-acetyltransferase
MEIQKATVNDIVTIQHLAEIIWPQAYSDIISQAQLQYMLKLIYSTASLTKQMEKGHQFVFAIENNIAIGFASYSAKSEEEAAIFRLHKIYVLPHQAVKGIGSFLLSHVCEATVNAAATSLELNVNKYNAAKLFYEKKGFTIIKEEVIDIGNGYVMDDYVMEKVL